MSIDYLQPMPRGRAATAEAVQAILQPLADLILTERKALGFSPTLRGWCYALEGLGVCTKGQFDDIERRITKMRKRGILPLDITAIDETRVASGGDDRVSKPLHQMMEDALDDVRYLFNTRRLADIAGIHVEIVVEKLDLVNLFNETSLRYAAPLTCLRGWTDMHSRAALLRRCAGYDNTVILMFGDHDVGGLQITDFFKDNLDDVLVASGLDCMPNILGIERVGLNAEDIERLGLVWIDGLETSSGDNLADPRHKRHGHRNVQDYLRQHGARKCEANALLRNPAAGVEIMVNAIREFIADDKLAEFKASLGADFRRAHAAVSKAITAIREAA